MAHDIFPLPELTFPLSIDTLAKKIAFGDSLSIHCTAYGCHHKADINLVQLARKLGPGHGCLDKDLRPYFHCSKCRAAGRSGLDFSFISGTSARDKSAWPRA